MPVHTAIVMLLILGSSGSFFWASNEFPHNRTANCESQPANQEDRKRLAEKAVAEGKLFESQGTADSLRKALEKYEKSLELWRSLDDRRAEASTLEYIGIVHYLLDQKQKALDVFQQELQLWRAEGDGPKQAEALNNIGVVYGSLGLEQKAIESYQQALPLRRAAGDRPGLASTLENIGMFYLNAGELQKALDEFNQALALYRELNERAGIANALNNIGGVHFTWGDYRKALEYFGQALELRRALGHRREEANNKIIGRVVVVGCDNLNPPPGFTAGQEYWTWRPGAAWRGTFTLVPVNTVPDYYSYSWATFPHEHFDLSRTVPMPSISPEAGDQFYRVQVRSDSRWVNQGWMWLINGTERVQEWYGRNLTSDLVGTGTAIRFTSAEPPAPGSTDVYLLIH